MLKIKRIIMQHRKDNSQPYFTSETITETMNKIKLGIRNYNKVIDSLLFSGLSL